ncbi:MAG: metal ABC transporter permease, partial [Pseudomonadota bacterium]
ENSRVKEDTVMGVVFSGMFAVGLVLYVAYPPGVDLDHILFGNMLGVGRADLITAGAIGAVVTVVVLAKWRDLLLHAFDPAQAQAAGLPVGWLHYGLLALISLSIVATLSAVGLILAVALLVTPGAVAFLLVRSFGWMMAVATAVCTGSLAVGVYLSFWINAAPAPTVVLVLTGLFVLAFAWRRWRTARATRSLA